MRIFLPLLKSSASSSRWISRQQKDPYVKSRISSKGKDNFSYRSRSSFKLISLINKHPNLLHSNSNSNSNSDNFKVIVDLGAAPGGWTQVISNLSLKFNLDLKIFALDLLNIEPIKNVNIIKGDFLSEKIRNELKIQINNHNNNNNEKEKEQIEIVDTILSDMMSPMTGNRIRDVQLSLQLCQIANLFARNTLKIAKQGEEILKIGNKRIFPGGNLVMKFFAHPDMDEFRSTELDPWFSKVVVEKPKESRAESSEAYWVCLGYKGDPATR
ncbi:uncharacterized protein I206_103130 [Kwoniella pini CBS 10737]|uniref:rRNA methyltransferase 2, mitochondrial n=1 Tax=Kwoniella pini CBS 10737 TaxID=1296096 RepID=A0A1B9IAS3_9TREE|nr:uncharacterized protein I206_01866 [Kwoniella pini CBS 10737]OCF52573.1 hypothetical protein I206_01866 [Kwoniella pini CBS 10737]